MPDLLICRPEDAGPVMQALVAAASEINPETKVQVAP
jgi:hypothetical protein